MHVLLHAHRADLCSQKFQALKLSAHIARPICLLELTQAQIRE